MAAESIYRISFLQQGELYEVYARQVSQGGLLGFVEVEDTRIPPGQALELAAAWKDGAVHRATAAKIVVRVEPDEYYERFYRAWLRGNRLGERERAQLEEALRRTQSSHYTALERVVPID